MNKAVVERHLVVKYLYYLTIYAKMNSFICSNA